VSVPDTIEALSEALRAVDGLRVTSDPGSSVQPPAVVLVPPALSWDGYQPDPTSASFLAALVVASNERALPRLFALLPQVAAAIHDTTDAVLVRADPGSWVVGGSELPAYLLQIEVAL
jgi:hypothetical protein